MSAPLKQSVTLNNALKMPVLGLGVYQSAPGPETEQAVRWALELGYRHVDTARVYRNEADVGRAIKASGIPRSDIFLTTKLWNGDQGYDSAMRALEASLGDLQTDYVDLYLVHWPLEGKRKESWRALEVLLKEGRCRSVGVSNYTERHLEELFGESSLVPAVNQVEFSPFLYQTKLLDFCMRRGVQLEAYGPLTQGKKLRHPAVAEIAAKKGRTAAQVLLRWAIQHDIVVIPKSVRRERIEENSKIFDFSLSTEEMAKLNGLNENFRTCWDPSNVP